jgi:hypothetical protein
MILPLQEELKTAHNVKTSVMHNNRGMLDEIRGLKADMERLRDE